VETEGLELALGALKPAEDGRGEILRLYEPHGARGECTLRFAGPPESVLRTNLLEDPEGTVGVQDTAVCLAVRPFEVVTLRIEWEKHKDNRGS
jgi:alpha-mannosidase